MYQPAPVAETAERTETPAPAAQNKPSPRLEYLDGLRGFAALYVVLFHVWTTATWSGESDLPELMDLAGKAMKFGRYAVAVFIVLSGYCLMLPVATSLDGKLRGGAWNYLKRRARRILPPYYAALAVSLLIIAFVPNMNRITNDPWDSVLPAFTPSVLASHALLIHNLSPDWLLKINGALWSVATEWQIYFFLPLLLLPVWRRLGLIPLILIAFAVGLAPHFLPGGRQFDGAAPWFLGLFAMGMAGAVIGFSEKRVVRFCRERIPWAAISLVCLGVFVYFSQHPAWVYRDLIWVGDIVIGLASLCLIIYCTRALTDRADSPPPDVLTLLGSRPAVALGAFSYSLYLMHAPIIGVLHYFLKRFALSHAVTSIYLLVLAVPTSLLFSYLFYLVFERRFTSGHGRSGAGKQPSEARR